MGAMVARTRGLDVVDRVRTAAVGVDHVDHPVGARTVELVLARCSRVSSSRH
jgi:hypothetical protein